MGREAVTSWSQQDSCSQRPTQEAPKQEEEGTYHRKEDDASEQLWDRCEQKTPFLCAALLSLYPLLSLLPLTVSCNGPLQHRCVFVK